MTGYERNQLLIEQDDILTSIQKIEKKDLLIQKYNRKVQPGDITEVHEDGWWENVAKKNPNSKMSLAFACIKILGEPVKDLQYLTQSWESAQIIHKNYRYTINYGLNDGDDITVKKEDLDITDKSTGIVI